MTFVSLYFVHDRFGFAGADHGCPDHSDHPSEPSLPRLLTCRPAARQAGRVCPAPASPRPIRKIWKIMTDPNHGDMTVHWHIAECASGRAIIHDQNGLVVAEVVAADAELVAAAPTLLGYLAGLLDDPLATIFDDLSNQEGIVAKLLKRGGTGAVEG
ncbi:hypothetical protein [Polyangium spumosum]|uniref:Uncharacterized protein n=1 Tax=Polyangium spumosum TaxID=889282 RepID=A0A6N7PY87_9BACT|nr:hypothetical protein [Polyangium spumosum]MRG94994.1 hypothetical protein [Polyangium spumosum]